MPKIKGLCIYLYDPFLIYKYMNSNKFLATNIYDFLNEKNNEHIQQLIDIISMNPSKYTKYIDILKDTYNIDFYNLYNDEKYINNIDLEDIKDKEDFLNFDNYIKYAKAVFKKRDIEQPFYKDKVMDSDEVIQLGNDLGFKIVVRDYKGNGNYAAFDLIDTIIIPPIVDVNTLIHEIGHFFDHNYSNGYIGLAKTITYASSIYHIDKNNEVFAENFLHYFISPSVLREKLPDVYNELNKKIPNVFKNKIKNILK